MNRSSGKVTKAPCSLPTKGCVGCALRESLRDTAHIIINTVDKIIYLPMKPKPEPKFESFSAPILKFQDSTTSSSMWWGWVWKSDCIPVSGGGIPPDIPRVEVKFTFSDGGMMDFNETYITLRERLFQYQEMRREMGPGADVPDEPLPAYEAITTPTSPAQPVPATSLNRPAPQEPPPDYDEAQAQHISNRLEDHIRDGVDRGDQAS